MACIDPLSLYTSTKSPAFTVGHILHRIRLPVHNELVVLVQIEVLPTDIRAPVIDEVRPFFLLGLLAGCLRAAPRCLYECGLAILGRELAVGIEPLGSDNLAGAGGDVVSMAVGFADEGLAKTGY